MPGTPATNVQATGLNDNNLLVGWAYDESGVYVAFAGDTVGLGTLGGVNSYALGVNNASYVVGQADTNTASPPTEHAFLYEGATLYDLNSLVSGASGWVLNSAVKVNNEGFIIGNGTYNGAATAFLLAPVVTGAPYAPHGPVNVGGHGVATGTTGLRP